MNLVHNCKFFGTLPNIYCNIESCQFINRLLIVLKIPVAAIFITREG